MVIYVGNNRKTSTCATNGHSIEWHPQESIMRDLLKWDAIQSFPHEALLTIHTARQHSMDDVIKLICNIYAVRPCKAHSCSVTCFKS